MPTMRLFLVLLLAAPIGALGGAFVLLAAIIVVLGLMAAVADWYLAADAQRVSLTRVLATDKLSLGAWNPVRLDLTMPWA